MSQDRKRRFQLGTRGSLLALWQARWVQRELESSTPDVGVDIVQIRTTGDRIQDRPLSAIGGKRLFTRELDAALLDDDIQLAVHSLKDLPFRLPNGLIIAAVMRRGDPSDAFVSDGRVLLEMPAGARIGTSSLRRRAQLLHANPSLKIEDLRGNVDTRLRKLDEGNFDAIVLSTAGLERLGFGDRISERLDPEVLLPAVGQGAVVAVCREADTLMRDALGKLDHAESRTAILAERSLLEVLEGNCQIPVGGYATVAAGELNLTGLLATPDGNTLVRHQMKAVVTDARALGHRLGQRILEAGGQEILDSLKAHGN